MASRTDGRDTNAKKRPGLLLDRAGLVNENEELRQANAQLRKRVEQLETLHEMGKLVTASSRLDEVLTRVVEEAVSLTEAEEGSLMLLDKQTNELYLRAQKGLGEKYAQGFRIKVKDSMAGEVVKTSKPQRLTSKERVLKVVTGYYVHSILYVPTIVEDEVIGVLSVDNQTPDRPFTEDDERLLSVLADYAAIAVENARLVTDLIEGTRVLTSLHRAGQSVLSDLSPDRVLRQIAESAREVLDADIVDLYQYVQERDEFVLPPILTGDRWYPEAVPQRIYEDDVVVQVVRGDKPRYVPQAQEDPTLVGEFRVPRREEMPEQRFVIRERIESSAMIPLKAGDETVGVIFVNYRAPHQFPPEEKERTEIFADQAAIAIQNARLFETVQRNAEELSALYDISLDITRQLKVKPLLKIIVQRAADLLGANGGGLLLCHPKRQEIEMVVAYKLPTMLGVRFEFGQGLVGRVAQSGEPLIGNHYHTWEDRDRRFDEEPYKNLFKAVVGVPLDQENKVIGVLAVSDTNEERVFENDDVKLLERFAAQAAIAIGNATTVSHLERLVRISPNAIIAVDRSGFITHFNEASRRIMGYKREEMRGESIVPFYYGGLEEAKKINSMLIEEDKKGLPVRDYETFVRGQDGEKIPVRFSGALLRDAYGTRIGSIGIITDLRELRLLGESYHALFEVGKVAVEIPDSDIRGICQEIVDVMTGKVHHFKASHLHLVNEYGDLEIMAGGGAAERYEEAELILKRGEGVTSEVLGTKQWLYVPNVQREKKFKYREWARGNDVHSYLGVPLIRVEGEVIGVIAVYTGEEYEFSREEIQFLERFASLAALVIDKAKEVDRSRKIAEALWQVTPDAVVLSGEDIGDLWAGVDRTIARMMPNTNLCLYVCDYVDRSIATRRESNSEILSSRLKSSWHKGDSPFISGVNVDPEAYLILGCHSAQEQLEGFLLLERTPTTDGVIERFDEIDRVILTTLASAVGSALFHQRRQIHIQSALNDAERSGQ